MLKKPEIMDLHDYILNENIQLKEENKKLSEENKSLFAKVSVLEERISQMKKGNAQLGITAESADAEPYGLAK